MKRLFVLFLLLVAAVASPAKEKTIAELVQEAQAAKPDHQAKLYVEIAERQLSAADKLYESGNSDAARANIEDVKQYSTRAANAAISSHKRLKQTEISLRKMESKLQDMAHSLDYSDQRPVQAAADQLETLRGHLLMAMFGKKAD